MKPIQIKNIAQIPFEGTHALPNSRQTLASLADVHTNHIDALTKGTLQSGQVWTWHEHSQHDELCIVLSGQGKLLWGNQSHPYQKDDVIIIPSGNRHQIEAEGGGVSEFFFIRIKV